MNAVVEEALKNDEPVVALESTIVAHGMPYPQNLDTAQSVEAIVRSKVSSFHVKTNKEIVERHDIIFSCIEHDLVFPPIP